MNVFPRRSPDHVAVVSGVTIREAVRRLPEDDREDLLAAYRSARGAS